jgi:hypothetical protein
MKLLKLLIFPSAFTFIKVAFLPSLPLLLWMGLVIMVNFFTGIAKDVVLQQARTSKGYRETVGKFFQYGGALFVGIALAHAGNGTENDHMKILLSYFNDGLVILIIYIEVTAIFENLHAMDKESQFAKFVIAPALKVLTWQIKNNPVAKAAEQTEKEPSNQIQNQIPNP